MKRPLTLATIVVTTALLLILAIVSLLGMAGPERASVGFGMPVADAAGALFYRVFVSRNLVIVAAGVIYLVTRQWRALAILISLTTLLAIFDMSVLSLDGRSPPGFHVVALVLLVASSTLLWWRTLSRRAEAALG
jgi:hypothetical protein